MCNTSDVAKLGVRGTLIMHLLVLPPYRKVQYILWWMQAIGSATFTTPMAIEHLITKSFCPTMHSPLGYFLTCTVSMCFLKILLPTLMTKLSFLTIYIWLLACTILDNFRQMEHFMLHPITSFINHSLSKPRMTIIKMYT